MIKAIETRYNGHRFRSRLEARWAVFFDMASIKYEYEPEGFTGADGTCYLPDFYLPYEDVYVEVKPQREGFEEEIHKAFQCIGENGIKRLLVLQEIPQKTELDLFWFPLLFRHPVSSEIDACPVCFIPTYVDEEEDFLPFFSLYTDSIFSHVSLFAAKKLWHTIDSVYAPIRDSAINSALNIKDGTPSLGKQLQKYRGAVVSYALCFDGARSARFEHGEKG